MRPIPTVPNTDETQLIKEEIALLVRECNFNSSLGRAKEVFLLSRIVARSLNALEELEEVTA